MPHFYYYYCIVFASLQCILYLLHTLREVFIWRKNYCHTNQHNIVYVYNELHKTSIDMSDSSIMYVMMMLHTIIYLCLYYRFIKFIVELSGSRSVRREKMEYMAEILKDNKGLRNSFMDMFYVSALFYSL